MNKDLAQSLRLLLAHAEGTKTATPKQLDRARWRLEHAGAGATRVGDVRAGQAVEGVVAESVGAAKAEAVGVGPAERGRPTAVFTLAAVPAMRGLRSGAEGQVRVLDLR